MSVTPETIAVALGQAAPVQGSVQWKQWELWITDAEMLIETRRLAANPVPVIDEAKLDYVVREAVVAQVKKPDDATQVTISVDDASSSRTYQSGKGRVTILDEWWTLLGLTESNGGAYSYDTVGTSSRHLPWCDLMFLGPTCSCGVNLAGRPIYGFGY